MRTKNHINVMVSILLVILLTCLPWMTVFAKTESISIYSTDTKIDSSGGYIEIKADTDVGINSGSFNLVYDNTLLSFGFYETYNMTYSVNTNYAENKIRVSFASTQTTLSGTIIRFWFNSKVDYSFTSEMKLETIRVYDSNGVFHDLDDCTFICSVEQKINLENAYLSLDQIKLGVGDTATINYVTSPINSSISQVRWNVSNSSIVSVDSNGMVKGLKEGNAKVFCDVYGANGTFFHLVCNISVFKKPNLSVVNVFGGAGSEIKVRIMMENSSNDVTSGSFNLRYNPSVVKLKNASVGELLSNRLTTINTEYSEDSIRVNFAGQMPLQTRGECLTLVFEAVESGVSQLEPYDIQFFTHDGQKYIPNVSVGSIEIKEIKTKTSIQKYYDGTYVVDVGFESDISILGGHLMFEYDTNSMELVRCTPSKTGNYAVVVNDSYDDGKVRLSFASTDVVNGSKIAAIILKPKGQDVLETDFCTVSGEFYDAQNNKVFPTSNNAYYSQAQVVDCIYGDVNGDKEINGRDVLMLRRYMANYDDDTGTSTIEVSAGADANGDGVINGKDVILLRRYMAYYDDDTGTSSVELGPHN